MMESWHVVGQKVVCIKDVLIGKHGYGFEKRPLLSAIYTIRAVEVRESDVCLLLEEIVNGIADYETGRCEFAFIASRFRPVRPTCVKQFRHLLTPTPESVRELEEVG